ncbi:pentapeptide repeat-containing protein [Streptomyces sp. NPDC059639]|uniref:pentapeptide repeat-containing protein n=1 Tax=Streptomyces sp. NPDC059639 TaxID=3346891 RepID=UPI0036747356
MSDEQPAPTRRPWWFWPTAAAGTAAFIVLLIWGPWWVEGHHLRDDKGRLVSSAGIIVTGFRTMLVAIAAGGFTAAGLYYTRQKHQLEREQFQHAQEQFTAGQEQFEATLRETRESQVTGRYVEAIKLLASDKRHEILGGIYSLERIMRDSARDAGTAIEVLAAFIRSAFHDHARYAEMVDVSTGKFAILGGEDLEPLEEPVRERANLKCARLTGTDLSHANLNCADLASASLKNADLTQADLVSANLHNADLTSADFTSADLSNTNLSDAKIDGADFSFAAPGTLTAEQVCSADGLHLAQLPPYLADDPLVQARIAEIEARLPARIIARLGGTRPAEPD